MEAVSTDPGRSDQEKRSEGLESHRQVNGYGDRGEGENIPVKVINYRSVPLSFASRLEFEIYNRASVNSDGGHTIVIYL